jgi:hypothetical protein
MSTILSPFPGWFITPNLPSVLIFFRRFFTWIALNDVDLRFSLILIAKPKSVEGGITSSA